MPTIAEQYQILAKMIEDLCEIKKEYYHLWHYTCGKSVPDDYRKAVDSLMGKAKNECERWVHPAPEILYWEAWKAFYRVDTPLNTEAIRRVLVKKLEIDLDV